MKKSSNKRIFKMDNSVCDLLLRNAEVDRVRVQGQAAQGLGRPRLMVDPFTGMIMACRLSYEEEETKSEH